MLSRIFDLFKDIRVIVGAVSTVMIVLSAFRYEVIRDDDENFNLNENQPENIPTIDKKVLDALSKFDRNVRHFLIKGKEVSKYDYLNILPEFKEAIAQATRLLNELKKLNLNTNYNCNDDRKRDFKKKGKKYGSDKTFSFSFRFGAHTYKLSMYWPKIVRLFLGDDPD